MIDNVWEGMYDHFKDVPICGDGFSSNKWASNSKEKMSNLLGMVKDQVAIQPVPAYRTTLLPLLVSLQVEKNGTIKILDFGGGLGFTYVNVINGLIRKERVEYHIVENKKICSLGKEIFSDHSQLYFHDSLPPKIGVDIIHIGSSLQYIAEWKELLKRLLDYKPKYFLFTDLPAGNIPTYVSAQNYYGSKIPHWFFNVEEVISVFNSLDFNLLFRSIFIAEILGEKEKYPQDNFPRKYRLGHSCNLLFGVVKND